MTIADSYFFCSLSKLDQERIDTKVDHRYLEQICYISLQKEEELKIRNFKISVIVLQFGHVPLITKLKLHYINLFIPQIDIIRE